MNRRRYVLTILSSIAINLVHAQSIIHPWKVVDNGGGRATSGGITLQSSIGQPAVEGGSSGGINLQPGYIPGVRQFTGTITLNLTVEGGWNMVSVPLVVSDYRKTTLYPSATSPAFAFVNGYVIRDTLENGLGYWIKFPSQSSIQMTGTSRSDDTIAVNANWNMIGSLSSPVLISDVTPIPPVTITSNFFGYSNAIGYFIEDTLKPGSGYWVKVSQAGQLRMQSGSMLLATTKEPLSDDTKSGERSGTSSLSDEEGINQLTFRDVEGKERTLYFSSTRNDLDVERYELPPLPPGGMLDIRYASQRMLEVAETDRTKEMAIRISSAVYPLIIAWSITGQSSVALIVDGKAIPISGIGKFEIGNEQSVVSLRLSPLVVQEIPKVFALEQNYPNPFNPVTQIKYALPNESFVALKVYNVLGQEIITLVNQVQKAGYMTVTWDGRNNLGHTVGSGIYFYRIEAMPADRGDAFVQVKKMLFLK
jgi:hypothetical protein